MGTATLRRRLATLETTLTVTPTFPPFTPDEIDALDQRARAGDGFTSVELKRVEQYSPLIAGELLITCYGGNLFIKRYVGIDLAEI